MWNQKETQHNIHNNIYILFLSGWKLQTFGEADRRWSPALQRRDELHPGARQDREGLRPAADRVVQEVETAGGQRWDGGTSGGRWPWYQSVSVLLIPSSPPRRAGPQYGTVERAWMAVMTEAEKVSELHQDVKNHLINEDFEKVKNWQKDSYHKQMMGGFKETKEADEGFKKAQKPWAKKLKEVRGGGTFLILMKNRFLSSFWMFEVSCHEWWMRSVAGVDSFEKLPQPCFWDDVLLLTFSDIILWSDKLHFFTAAESQLSKVSFHTSSTAAVDVTGLTFYFQTKPIKMNKLFSRQSKPPTFYHF